MLGLGRRQCTSMELSSVDAVLNTPINYLYQYVCDKYKHIYAIYRIVFAGPVELQC